MTNAKAKKDINQVQLSSFQNEIIKLKENADNWFDKEFKTANERLYEMFASLYQIYEGCRDLQNTANTLKQTWLKEQCEKRGITLPKKPTLQTLLVKYAFDGFGAVDSKRISAYVRVFTIATTIENVMAENIVSWIKENGGIEEIRQQSTKSAVTKKQRSDEGMKILANAQTLTCIKTDLTSSYAATKVDEVVLLVGFLQADGIVAVKHTLFSSEDNSSIKGSTAINAALCNVYSKHKELEKKGASKAQAEIEAVSEINTVAEIIADAQTTEVEMKEVA